MWARVPFYVEGERKGSHKRKGRNQGNEVNKHERERRTVETIVHQDQELREKMEGEDKWEEEKEEEGGMNNGRRT
ncbi:hypothetical protein E2C01_083451 [Portunus trituberculatus]|uniref:Uncharacterized protein n=1 Tax=Portunus trituberculatus TaxID=210409 RepID=A0A5B7J226_PORTR|nr:hypothetical protein [Portunus trituberculatus]